MTGEDQESHQTVEGGGGEGSWVGRLNNWPSAPFVKEQLVK